MIQRRVPWFTSSLSKTMISAGSWSPATAPFRLHLSHGTKNIVMGELERTSQSNTFMIYPTFMISPALTKTFMIYPTSGQSKTFIMQDDHQKEWWQYDHHQKEWWQNIATLLRSVQGVTILLLWRLDVIQVFLWTELLGIAVYLKKNISWDWISTMRQK